MTSFVVHEATFHTFEKRIDVLIDVLQNEVEIRCRKFDADPTALVFQPHGRRLEKRGCRDAGSQQAAESDFAFDGKADAKAPLVIQPVLRSVVAEVLEQTLDAGFARDESLAVFLSEYAAFRESGWPGAEFRVVEVGVSEENSAHLRSVRSGRVIAFGGYAAF